MLEKVLNFESINNQYNNIYLNCESILDDIVCSGNIKLAKFFLKLGHKQNDKLVTKAFLSVIESSSGSKLDEFQSKNLLKKLYSGLNPLLTACINPCKDILKAAL